MSFDLAASFDLDCSAFTKAVKEMQNSIMVLHTEPMPEPKIEMISPPVLQCDGCGSRQFKYMRTHNECEFCGNHYPPFNNKPISIVTSVSEIGCYGTKEPKNKRHQCEYIIPSTILKDRTRF